MEDYCKSIVKSFEELFYDQIDRINARDRDEDEEQGCFMIPENLFDEGSTDVPSDCDSCDECADDAYFSELSGDGKERDKFACPRCCMLRAEKWAERARDVVCEASTWKMNVTTDV